MKGTNIVHYLHNIDGVINRSIDFFNLLSRHFPCSQWEQGISFVHLSLYSLLLNRTQLFCIGNYPGDPSAQAPGYYCPSRITVLINFCLFIHLQKVSFLAVIYFDWLGDLFYIVQVIFEPKSVLSDMHEVIRLWDRKCGGVYW